MPFGGNDWLALRSEPTLEPDLPICDPHHHFWDFRTERIPYQRYLLHELADDVNSGHNVARRCSSRLARCTGQAGRDEMRPVGEVEFVQGLAAAAARAVCTAPLVQPRPSSDTRTWTSASASKPVLQALQAASPNRFRGIRHSVTWDPHPELDGPAGSRGREGQLGTDAFRAGARVLARMGMSFEACCISHSSRSWWNLPRPFPIYRSS